MTPRLSVAQPSAGGDGGAERIAERRGGAEEEGEIDRHDQRQDEGDSRGSG